MPEYEDGHEIENLQEEKEKLAKQQQDEIAKQYLKQKEMEKKKGLHFAVYMVFAVIGIAAFFGLFYMFFSEIKSWFG